jgi:ATP-dependent DNA helicase 2 subunit 2
VNHAVKTRAIYTDGSIPDIPPMLLQYQNPPQKLLEQVQSQVEALIDAAEVKKGSPHTQHFSFALLLTSFQVPPKAKGKRRRDPVKPISGLDVDALLGGERKGKVTAENAVPDFKNALDAAASVEEIEDAAKQLGAIIRDLITESFGDSKYDRAMESFGVLREELINLEEPHIFNNFVKDLKKSLLSGALGGDRRDFWFKIRYSKLGLIDKLESEASDVKAEEAEQVCIATYRLAEGLLLTTFIVLQVEVTERGDRRDDPLRRTCLCKRKCSNPTRNIVCETRIVHS